MEPVGKELFAVARALFSSYNNPSVI